MIENVCSASGSKNGLYEMYKEILKNDIKLIIEQFKIDGIEERLELIENKLKKNILQNILMRWSIEHPEDKDEIEEDMKNLNSYKPVKDNKQNRKKRKYLNYTDFSKKNKRQINKKKKFHSNIPKTQSILYKHNLDLNHTVENDISSQIVNRVNNSPKELVPNTNNTKSFLYQRHMLEISGIKNQCNNTENPSNVTKTNTTTSTIRKNKFRERLEELMHKIEFNKLYMNNTLHPSNTYDDKFFNNDKNSDSLSETEKHVKNKGDYMKIWLNALRTGDFHEKPFKVLYIPPKLETNENYLNKHPYKYSYISKPDKGILVMKSINFENIKNSSINIFNIDNRPSSKCSCCSQENLYKKVDPDYHKKIFF